MRTPALLAAGVVCGLSLAGVAQHADAATLRVAPGGSLSQAVDRAAPGDVIELQPGTYPHQTISRRAASGAPIVIRPQRRGTVRLGYIEIRGSGLDIRDLATGGWYVHSGSRDITMRRVRSSGGTFISSAHNVRLIGGGVHGVDSVDGLQIKRASAGDVDPSRILLDRFTISGVTRDRDPSKHTECIQVMAARGMVIRDSIFRDCSTQGVFFKEDLGGTIHDVVVENSWFGRLSGYNTLIWDDGVSGMVARFNIFAQSPRLNARAGASDLTAVGNVGELSSCGRGVEYRGNHWSGTRCGPTDLRRGVPFPVSTSEPPRWSSIRRVTAPPKRSRDVTVRVRAGGGATTFMVRGESKLSLQVRDPSGKRVRGSRTGRGRGYTYVTVRNPQRGVWKLRVATRGTRSSTPVLVTSHR